MYIADSMGGVLDYLALQVPTDEGLCGKKYNDSCQKFWDQSQRIVETVLEPCEKKSSRGRIECLPLLRARTGKLKIVVEYYTGRS